MRNSSLFVLFGSLVIVTFVPRCGDGTTDCTQTSTCPSDASDGPPPLTCDTTKDPKDAPGCLDDRVGVFVDGALGKDANPGTKELPFQTIGKALTGVGALTRVYVCEGTYSEDITITPPVDGISIYGGFKCADWTYSGNKPTVGKSQIALTINGTTKAIAIEDFLIKSADGTAGNASSIAALVSGATAPITFTRVNLTAGVGVAATDAAAGSNWTIASSSDPAIKGKDATGASGGNLQTCANLCTDTNTSTGGTGGAGTTNPTDGQTGSPNLGGGAGGSHLVSCGAGGTGGNGNGATTGGADATSPAALGTLASTGWTPGSAAAGKNGTPGQGGGGGAGQSQSNDGGGGGGACGGCGGGGGGGGSGGGSSIALAVVSSSVTVNASELHAGDAGNGGKGAAGQVGQTGGAHGNGSGFGCSGGNGG
ncbi:MAG TPA: hypothetical protein VH054_13565, partial [Polyangiaceae bacterium]|nr:hypothetical protein [Polyangiaceae bacterium]